MHNTALDLLGGWVVDGVFQRKLLRLTGRDLQVPFDVVQLVKADRFGAIVFLWVLDHRLLQ